VNLRLANRHLIAGFGSILVAAAKKPASKFVSASSRMGPEQVSAHVG
jgi:hypothetical protein